MFFMLLAAALAALAALPQMLRGRKDWRSPLRWGIGLAFLFTGADHFLSLETRYVPMVPPYLGAWARELVLISGALEVAGAVGLLLPDRAWSRLGLPSMRASAGVGLAMLLSAMVAANGHMAEADLQAEGLQAGADYLAIRPLLQPLIVLWVLVAAGVFPPVCRGTPGSSDAPRRRESRLVSSADTQGELR